MPDNRSWRDISSFHRVSDIWIPVADIIELQDPASSLSLVSWNIDAFSYDPIGRAKLILDHISSITDTVDIIFLQEVNDSVRKALLDDEWIRSSFHITDAESTQAWEGVPFATMTLLSISRFVPRPHDTVAAAATAILDIPGIVSRVAWPSIYGRDALCVDISLPGISPKYLRLINVHLDSLQHTRWKREQQIEIAAKMLREPSCVGGLVAGDFNAIHDDDQRFVDNSNLTDAWLQVHDTDPTDGTIGATWSVGVKRQDNLLPGRLDKVAMFKLVAEAIDVLPVGNLEVPASGGELVMVPWSDHSGLCCAFRMTGLKKE